MESEMIKRTDKEIFTKIKEIRKAKFYSPLMIPYQYGRMEIINWLTTDDKKEGD